MQALQDITILAPLKGDKDQLKRLRDGAKTLQKATSVNALYHAAKNPLQTMGHIQDAVEEWTDGLTREQRQEYVHSGAQKTLRSMQQRHVSGSLFRLDDRQHDQAQSLAEWEAASKELDILEGNNAWKKEDESGDYDSASLQEHMNALQQAKTNGDINRMLYLVRTTFSRDMARMSNLKLYQYSHLGTKEKVENYIQVAIDTLNTLVEASDQDAHGISPFEIYNNLLSTRQSFGRSAMLLSGGGTFGMNHIGVLKTLWQANLLPRIISGASAGSIVASIMCTCVDEEIPALLESFCDGDLAVFHDPNESAPWLRTLGRLLVKGSMFDIAHLIRVMQGFLGNMTFLEAYNRTRRILNICVSSASMYELPKLLNYVTSPHVMIWSAVAASCSVPLVFSPASLLVKDPRTGEVSHWTGGQDQQKWIDGSVDNDLPMQRLSEMFNVNHFIVSQVNPHVIPFLVKDKDMDIDGQDLDKKSFRPSPSWFRGLSLFAKTEVIHRMTMLSDAGVMPNILTKLAAVLSQTYSGDITILPEVSFIDFPTVLSNPTPEFMRDTMLRGERATWPKLSRIRNHCAIELSLDNALNQVRARTVFGENQARVRRQAFKRTQSYDGQRRTNGTVDRPLGRKFSQSSDPGADFLGSARKIAPAKSHLRAPSDAPSTKIPLIFSSGYGDTTISPAPGLTSDDDGADFSSLSSSGEEHTGSGRRVANPVYPSFSMPASPTDMYRQAPCLLALNNTFTPTDEVEESHMDMSPKTSPEESQYKRMFLGKDTVPSGRIVVQNSPTSTWTPAGSSTKNVPKPTSHPKSDKKASSRFRV